MSESTQEDMESKSDKTPLQFAIDKVAMSQSALSTATTHENGDQQQNVARTKRGWRPHSKRNRKRPKSQVHGTGKGLEHHTTIKKLELSGKPIPTSTGIEYIRVVEPYPYTFVTYAKARWQDRTILDVYSTEFGSYPKSYYESAIRQGRILVSDEKVDINYKIKGPDILSHTVHRHEPGIAIQHIDPPHITIVEETDHVLVVDKPGTIPIHPCGGYHVQSIMEILSRHYKRKLYTIHRLDRLTSGLVILGKTSDIAQKWGKCIMERTRCQKIYLTRVKGKFPLNCNDEKIKQITDRTITKFPWYGEWIEDNDNQDQISPVDVYTVRKQNAYGYWVVDEYGNHVEEIQEQQTIQEQVFQSQHSVNEWLQSIKENKKDNFSTSDVVITRQINENNNSTSSNLWFHIACPARIAKHKDGVCEAGPFDDLSDEQYLKTVKPAASSFGVVSYDQKTNSTLLICRPYTGRTHQLRLHLQHIGHPIANDPNYGGDMWYCNPDGREACQIAQSRLDIINDAKLDNDGTSSMNGNTDAATQTTAIDVPATEHEIQNRISEAKQDEKESIHDFIRRTCVWCARCKSAGGTDRAILEFLIRSPGIWLHALQYSFMISDGSDGEKEECVQTFRTPLPAWHDM